MRYVALLRGINVGKRQVKMKDLQAAFVGLGYPDATTHIQSGNVLFTSNEAERPLIAELDAGLTRVLGMEIRVILRSAAELRQLVEHGPFAGADESDGIKRYVTFLAKEPTAAQLEYIASTLQSAEETNTVVGRELYTTQTVGIAKSLFTTKFNEKKWGILITMRNWNVTQALSRLLGN